MLKQNDIDTSRLPNHIGIILDGNGRWAIKRGLPRTAGHKVGIEAVKLLVRNCLEIGIKNISLFAFSTENWKRDKEEVDAIFSLVNDYVEEELNFYLENGVKVVTMGDITALPKNLYQNILIAKDKTQNGKKLVVNLGINYGGRDEILWAVNKLLEKGQKNISKQDFQNELYTRDLPELDLIIRTSGEQRLSNFMLYQCAYAEFYFPTVDWPAFAKKDLIKAIYEFQKRDRRFGGLKEKKK